MDILAVLAVLLVLLFAASFSCGRSYFARGRLAGMEEATREIVRGICSHYETAGQVVPDPVAKAMKAVYSYAGSASSERGLLLYHARLWTFGDAVGSACWRTGFETCRQQMGPREGRVRLDLPIDDLLSLASLAHLGFKKMMPNDRGIETVRFKGEQHALSVTRALDRLELAIPELHRPSAHAATRQVLIRNWWPPERKSA